jgi:ABC-type multidrug transport system fused ATPase/permease subunit
MFMSRGDHERGHTQPEQPEKANLSLKSINWGRLFGYLKPYRKQMILAVLALLISSAFGLSFPLIIVRLLDSVTKTHSYGPLNMLAGLLVLIFLLQAL